MKQNYRKLGEYIEILDRRNTDMKLGIDSVRGISNTKKITETSKATVDENVISKFYVINPGEFIYNPRTTRMGDKVGLALNNTDTPLLFTFNNLAFKIKDSKKKELLPDFLYLFFCRSEFDRYARINSWGSATELFLFDALCEMELPVPDLTEQQRIVNAYNTVDRRIRLLQQVNEKLETTAQCLFDEEFKDDLNKEEISFTQIIDLLGGGTPSTTEPSYWNGEIPFFAPADIDNSIYCFKTEKTLTEEGLKNCSSKLYPENMTFVTCRGTVGKLALAGVPMAMNQSCYALKDNEGKYPFFTYYFSKFVVSKLKNKASGAVFSALVTRDFDLEKVFIPKQEKKETFEKQTVLIFSNIKNNEKEIIKLQELRQLVISRISGI